VEELEPEIAPAEELLLAIAPVVVELEHVPVVVELELGPAAELERDPAAERVLALAVAAETASAIAVFRRAAATTPLVEVVTLAEAQLEPVVREAPIAWEEAASMAAAAAAEEGAAEEPDAGGKHIIRCGENQ
jgi:hypothetical protein